MVEIQGPKRKACVCVGLSWLLRRLHVTVRNFFEVVTSKVSSSGCWRKKKKSPTSVAVPTSCFSTPRIRSSDSRGSASIRACKRRLHTYSATSPSRSAKPRTASKLPRRASPPRLSVRYSITSTAVHRSYGQALLRLLRCVPDARLGLCQKGSQQRSQSLAECSRILPDARSGADSASARHVGARVRQTWHRKAKRSSAACRVILYDVWIRAIEWRLRSR